MKCLFPFVIKSGSFEEIITCGKCIVCLENRIKTWFIRIMCEIGYADYAKFITLTYRDEEVPMINGVETLRHKDFQDYIKRVRKMLGDIRMKYYMCGEYGERMGRPHYHAVILLYGDLKKKKSQEILQSKWSKGFVHIGTVTPKSVRYCLDYLNKLAKKEYDINQVRPYQKVSQGFGLNYMLDNEKQISELKYLAYNNVKYEVPRYFRKKSEKIDQEIRNMTMSEDYASTLEERKETYIKNKIQGIRDNAEQTRKNIIARKKIKRGSL